MVHGEVVGLMNRELAMGGILEGDCKDRMAVYWRQRASASVTSIVSLWMEQPGGRVIPLVSI